MDPGRAGVRGPRMPDPRHQPSSGKGHSGTGLGPGPKDVLHVHGFVDISCVLTCMVVSSQHFATKAKCVHFGAVASEMLLLHENENSSPKQALGNF